MSITYREPRVGREAKCVSSSLHHQTTTKNSALTMPNGLPSKAGLFDLRPSTASIAVANVDGGWARPGLSPGYTFLRDGAERHWPRLGGVVPSSWWTPSVASCRAAGGTPLGSCRTARAAPLAALARLQLQLHTSPAG